MLRQMRSAHFKRAKFFLDVPGCSDSPCIVNLISHQKYTEKHRLYHCPEWHEIRREIPETFRKWEQRAKTSKEEWKWQRGIVAHPLSESQWNGGNFRMKIWESEKHQSWRMQVEGFRGHVATDGSLRGKGGKCGACGWAVVQMDYDERWGPCKGCTAQWRRNAREGGADGLLLPSQQSDWSY